MLFKLRTRMTNVKDNFKTMYDNLQCNLCDQGILQTDSHLLYCKTIIDNCPMLANDMDTEYEDIFSDFDKQLKVAKIYKEVFDTKYFLEEQSEDDM